MIITKEKKIKDYSYIKSIEVKGGCDYLTPYNIVNIFYDYKYSGGKKTITISKMFETLIDDLSIKDKKIIKINKSGIII
jgi:hypothetical protein